MILREVIELCLPETLQGVEIFLVSLNLIPFRTNVNSNRIILKSRINKTHIINKLIPQLITDSNTESHFFSKSALL